MLNREKSKAIENQGGFNNKNNNNITHSCFVYYILRERSLGVVYFHTVVRKDSLSWFLQEH